MRFCFTIEKYRFVDKLAHSVKASFRHEKCNVLLHIFVCLFFVKFFYHIDYLTCAMYFHMNIAIDTIKNKHQRNTMNDYNIASFDII